MSKAKTLTSFSLNVPQQIMIGSGSIIPLETIKIWEMIIVCGFGLVAIKVVKAALKWEPLPLMRAIHKKPGLIHGP
jgi:hypothetical protein